MEIKEFIENFADQFDDTEANELSAESLKNWMNGLL